MRNLSSSLFFLITSSAVFVTLTWTLGIHPDGTLNFTSTSTEHGRSRTRAHALSISTSSPVFNEVVVVEKENRTEEDSITTTTPSFTAQQQTLATTSSSLSALAMPHLPSLPYCVNVKLRGFSDIFNISTARHILQQQQRSSSSSSNNHDGAPNSRHPRRTGIVTVENAHTFVGLSKGWFHFFHFMEFMILAFSESINLDLQVQWWYTPLLTQDEICGTAQGLNCLVMHWFFPSLHTVHGIESNSPEMHDWDPSYHGVLRHRAKWNNNTPLVLQDNNHTLQQRHDAMLDEVDVLLMLNRDGCGREDRPNRMHKIWTQYLDSFPLQVWTDRFTQNSKVATTTTTTAQEKDHPTQKTSLPPPPPEQFRIGYIDRQKTRRRLPDDFHDWLVGYLQNHPLVDFQHLHMEEYSAIAQILQSHQLDMMVGVHGNGLTHQFWMRPQSYVLELYWNYPFQYDYASSAMLMNHTYRGLYNGVVLNETRIAHRETKMLLCCPDQSKQWNYTSAQTAVKDFVEMALARRKQQHKRRRRQ